MGLTSFNRIRRQRTRPESSRPVSPQSTEPEHIGGGWYRVPGLDDPVQGKEAAEEAARNQG